MTLITLAVTFGILVGYPLTSRFLLTLAQPKRLRLAEVGRLIIDHKDVDPKLKTLVRSMMADSYSSFIMVTMAFLLPFAGFRYLVKRPKIRSFANPELQTLFDELVDLHIFATSAANPIFAILVAAEMAVLTLFLFPFGQERKGRIVQVDALRRAERHPGALAA